MAESDRLLQRCMDNVSHLPEWERASVEKIAALRAKFGYITHECEQLLAQISENLPESEVDELPAVERMPGVPD